MGSKAAGERSVAVQDVHLDKGGGESPHFF